MLMFFNRNQESSWKKHKLPLEQITEETESYAETVLTQKTFIEFPMKNDGYIDEYNKEEKTPSKFLCEFIKRVSKNKPLYLYFINQAVEKGVLQIFFRKKGKSQSLFNPNRIMIKRNSVSPKPGDSERGENDSVISDNMQISNSSRKGILQNHPYLSKRMKRPIRHFDDNSSQSSSSVYLATPAGRFRKYKKEVQGIQYDSLKTYEIFENISGGKAKISSEDFQKFLAIRYPDEVADTITTQFTFRQGTFDDYVTELNRFINSGEIKHLEFCFNVFDFNKDKFICQKDAYKALELRNSNYYDSDIASIIDLFNLKKDGKLPSSLKLRRKSTLSLIKEKRKKKTKDILIKAEKKKNSNSIIQINFKEFCVIKFNGRPQLFLDFLNYTCDYNFLKGKGLLLPSPMPSVRTSEEIVTQINENTEFHERIRKNDKYNYYCELENAMSFYNQLEIDDLLKKFKYLQSTDKFKYKVITKHSIVSKLVIFIKPALIGFDVPYLSLRIYEYLSRGKDLTKPNFFSSIYKLTKANQSPIKINKLAFDLYDYRNDNLLTVDEIYKMFEALPVGSSAYNECEKIVNIFILSIFDRIRLRFNGIDFNKFSELCKNSVIGAEVFKLFTKPFEECLESQNTVFRSVLLNENSIIQHNTTKDSLLKLLD